MTNRKGIILAGGSGTRLYPITMGVSKQLLPIYDKPMIFYPLSVLMLAGIREIAVITTPEDQGQFQRLLGDGSQWGLSFTYIVQPTPDGLAQAYLLAREFLNGAPSAMVLGDNIFFAPLRPEIDAWLESGMGARVLLKEVADPRRFGVARFEGDRLVEVVEKPADPPSNYAVTGIYFYDRHAFDAIEGLRPSGRGEYEIADVNNAYIARGELGWGVLEGEWSDAGTHPSLARAQRMVSGRQAGR